jgi:hypothetical protein
MAACSDAGTDSAHRLFWHTKTTGSRCTLAKFNASCQPPREVAPSPK